MAISSIDPSLVEALTLGTTPPLSSKGVILYKGDNTAIASTNWKGKQSEVWALIAPSILLHIKCILFGGEDIPFKGSLLTTCPYKVPLRWEECKKSMETSPKVTKLRCESYIGRKMYLCLFLFLLIKRLCPYLHPIFM
jgi:hypothetical protein